MTVLRLIMTMGDDDDDDDDDDGPKRFITMIMMKSLMAMYLLWCRMTFF